MGGYFPGPLGFASLVTVKFGGYALAGIALKKLQPTITASVVKIAATQSFLFLQGGPTFHDQSYGDTSLWEPSGRVYWIGRDSNWR